MGGGSTYLDDAKGNPYGGGPTAGVTVTVGETDGSGILGRFTTPGVVTIPEPASAIPALTGAIVFAAHGWIRLRRPRRGPDGE